FAGKPIPDPPIVEPSPVVPSPQFALRRWSSIVLGVLSPPPPPPDPATCPRNRVSCTEVIVEPAGIFPAISKSRRPRRGEFIPLVPANKAGPAPLLLAAGFSKMVASLLAPIVMVSAAADAASMETIETKMKVL